MKVSDYIVEYIIEQGITDVFGYPGGMVTHLMDSFSKYNDNKDTITHLKEELIKLVSEITYKMKQLKIILY